MEWLLGVGVPRVETGGDFDLWLPIHMVLAFLLIRSVVGLRASVGTAIAAFAGGTVWAWSTDVFGVIPAAATAVVVATATGTIARRASRPQAGHE